MTGHEPVPQLPATQTHLRPAVMIVDDEAEMRSMVADFLRGRGLTVIEQGLASEALSKIEAGDFASPDIGEVDPCWRIDVVVSDLNMPGMNGIQFVERMKTVAPDVPVVLVTAFGSIETAIEATRKGAWDYITKPFKLAEMGATIDRALKFRELRRENILLQKEVQNRTSFANIIGKSPGMREVFDLIQRVAGANANVLITGESGTGKERVARAIHSQGPRRNRSFVAINCTAIPDALLESELFGHARGAFTGAIQRKRGLFEEADGGTIFLDEIGDMDLSLQAKLLRVIQERRIRAVGDNLDREVDVRIIAASHKDLKAAIKNGSFREDLYYRLAVIPVVIPPLRHRREDIPLLAEHFLEKYARLNRSSVKSISPGAMARLVAHSWEGNVRELENLIERAVVLTRGTEIVEADLPQVHRSDVEGFVEANLEGGTLPTLDAIEQRYIKFVLEKTGGKKEKAAQILGINRRTLYRKEREYGWVAMSPELEGGE